MANAVATAIYNDTWAGEVAAVLLPFKTKRKGVSVIRYRWHELVRGFECGGWASPFVTVDQAVANAKRHRMFKDVQPVAA